MESISDGEEVAGRKIAWGRLAKTLPVNIRANCRPRFTSVSDFRLVVCINERPRIIVFIFSAAGFNSYLTFRANGLIDCQAHTVNTKRRAECCKVHYTIELPRIPLIVIPP